MDRTIDTREQGMSDTTDLMRLTYFSRHDLACDADGFNPAFTAIEQGRAPQRRISASPASSSARAPGSRRSSKGRPTASSSSTR
jgi:hypothetical protein